MNSRLFSITWTTSGAKAIFYQRSMPGTLHRTIIHVSATHPSAHTKEPSSAFIVVHTNPQFDIQRSLAVFMHVPISGPSMMTTISGQIPERCSAVAKMQNQLKTTIFYLVWRIGTHRTTTLLIGNLHNSSTLPLGFEGGWMERTKRVNV